MLEINKKVGEIFTLYKDGFQCAGYTVSKEYEELIDIYFEQPGEYSGVADGTEIKFNIIEEDKQIDVKCVQQENFIKASITSESVISAIFVKVNGILQYGYSNLSTNSSSIAIDKGTTFGNNKLNFLVQTNLGNVEITKDIFLNIVPNKYSDLHIMFKENTICKFYRFVIDYNNSENDIIIIENSNTKEIVYESPVSEEYCVDCVSGMYNIYIKNKGKVMKIEPIVFPEKKLYYRVINGSMCLDLDSELLKSITLNGEPVSTTIFNIDVSKQNIIEISDKKDRKFKIVI